MIVYAWEEGAEPIWQRWAGTTVVAAYPKSHQIFTCTNLYTTSKFFQTNSSSTHFFTACQKTKRYCIIDISALDGFWVSSYKYYRKRGSASYIVCEVRSVRERERERGRRKWRHLSSAEIGDEVCTFPCQRCAPYYWRRVLHFSLPKICTSFSPLEWRRVHTFRCQKCRTLRNILHSSFCFCQMAWQGIEAPKQTMAFPAAPSFFSLKKMNQKLLVIEKEIVHEVALGG